MLELASEISLCLVLAGLLGLAMGYYLAKGKCENKSIESH